MLSVHLLLLMSCSFIIFHEPYNVLFNVLGQRKNLRKNILIMKDVGLGREGKRRERRERKLGLRLISANRSGGPFEVCSSCAVNSLKTCVMSECEASSELLLLSLPDKCQTSHL